MGFCHFSILKTPEFKMCKSVRLDLHIFKRSDIFSEIRDQNSLEAQSKVQLLSLIHI